jgi:transposase
MRVTTLIQKSFHIKGFVYENDKIIGAAEDDPGKLVVQVREDLRMRGKCSVCGKKGPCYDHLELRDFETVPINKMPVIFQYRRRRINCKTCGVRVEKLEWCASLNLGKPA